MARMTVAERKQVSRARRQAQGLVELAVWVPVERVEDVKRFAESLRRERKPAAPLT